MYLDLSSTGPLFGANDTLIAHFQFQYLCPFPNKVECRSQIVIVVLYSVSLSGVLGHHMNKTNHHMGLFLGVIVALICAVPSGKELINY